ncbi:hypothetical protein RRG08_058292 [Elysia crispata]|uniref:Uncharacterized protein n=1 Tax=Elysia crispata TaxID=231223 RepID=A0AAE1D5W9_9GAST|nr:hypothetical protein RRG08_058292 [Elysia crispata]
MNELVKNQSGIGTPVFRGHSVNKTKTTFTIFTLLPKKCIVKLEISGCSLQKDDNPTYLEVTFDTRLTWKNEKDKCLKKGMHRTALIKISWLVQNGVPTTAYSRKPTRDMTDQPLSAASALGAKELQQSSQGKKSEASKPQSNHRRHEIIPHSGDGNPLRPTVHR